MRVKRLLFDIETSPNIGWFWRSGNRQSVSSEQILKERRILCICYKWYGKESVHSLTWDRKQDDRKMLQKFIPIMECADEVVAQNGDNFDLKWLRTRCFFHKIPMPPHIVTTDTLKKLQEGFNLNSNRLGYATKYAGVVSKSSAPIEWWVKATWGNCRESLGKLVDYCRQDVVALEQFYSRILPYITNNTHHPALHGLAKYNCPQCASNRVIYYKPRATAAGTIKHQLKCSDCRSYFTVNNKTYKEYLKSFKK